MNLSEKDHQFIWHPYTHQKDRNKSIVVDSAKGSILFDDRGNEYIDAISSWWVTIHGHSHRYIAKKIYQQARKLEHVIFAGFTHKPAVEFAERLLPLLPGKFEKVFYSDNGSTAVEVALKMSLQYHQNKNDLKKNKILALNNSYHGDTFGAMSASSRSIFTKAFDDKLFEVIFIDCPTPSNFESVIASIDKQASEIACFIYEPLLQGAGGMKMYEAADLNVLLEYLKSKNIICIADEVLTGFYRTGKMFASSHCKIQPDIICLSKGITGGTMPMGVTACTSEIYESFVSIDKSKTFYHGHSFTANPLSCAAALASLDLIEQKKFRKQLVQLITLTAEFTEMLKIKSMDLNIKNVRQSGTIVAFEIITSEGDSYLNDIMLKFSPYCLKRGVYLRSLGNTIYTMPPYCTSKKQLKKIFSVILSFLTDEIIPT